MIYTILHLLDLDAINLGNILYDKSVKSKIPSYFKDQSVPIISYTYTTPIATNKLLTTRMCCRISILTISSLILLIAHVHPVVLQGPGDSMS